MYNCKFLRLWNLSKLFSRKIRVAENLLTVCVILFYFMLVKLFENYLVHVFPCFLNSFSVNDNFVMVLNWWSRRSNNCCQFGKKLPNRSRHVDGDKITIDSHEISRNFSLFLLHIIFFFIVKCFLSCKMGIPFHSWIFCYLFHMRSLH